MSSIKLNSIIKQSYYKRRLSISKSGKVVNAHIKDILLSVKPLIDKPIKEIAVLDVGSGTGEYCFAMEKYVKTIVGVEPFTEAYLIAKKRAKQKKSKIVFYNDLIENFNTKHKFDLILCLTVIEHMPQAKDSFKNIFSVLRKSGTIYLTAPNKLWPYESHYKLYFLSWFPIGIANLYMRLAGRGTTYNDSAYSKSYFGMRSFFNQFKCEYKFILPYDSNGLFMSCGTGGAYYSFIKNLGINMIRKYPFFWFFSKGFIMVVKKNR